MGNISNTKRSQKGFIDIIHLRILLILTVMTAVVSPIVTLKFDIRWLISIPASFAGSFVLLILLSVLKDELFDSEDEN